MRLVSCTSSPVFAGIITVVAVSRHLGPVPYIRNIIILYPYTIISYYHNNPTPYWAAPKTLKERYSGLNVCGKKINGLPCATTSC